MNENYLSEHSFIFTYLIRGRTMGLFLDTLLFRNYAIEKKIVKFDFPNPILKKLSEIKGIDTNDPEMIFQWRIVHVKKWNIKKDKGVPPDQDVLNEFMRNARGIPLN